NALLDQTYTAEHPGARTGNHVLLAVSDSGIGMSSDIQSHLFEPFFTTKEQGKGTGLGLATAYGIVKQSEGYIAVQSAIGHGTTFEVYLPRVDAALGGLEERETRRPPRGSETILIVEDDPAVLVMTREMLENQG